MHVFSVHFSHTKYFLWLSFWNLNSLQVYLKSFSVTDLTHHSYAKNVPKKTCILRVSTSLNEIHYNKNIKHFQMLNLNIIDNFFHCCCIQINWILKYWLALKHIKSAECSLRNLNNIYALLMVFPILTSFH